MAGFRQMDDASRVRIGHHSVMTPLREIHGHLQAVVDALPALQGMFLGGQWERGELERLAAVTSAEAAYFGGAWVLDSENVSLRETQKVVAGLDALLQLAIREAPDVRQDTRHVIALAMTRVLEMHRVLIQALGRRRAPGKDLN